MANSNLRIWYRIIIIFVVIISIQYFYFNKISSVIPSQTKKMNDHPMASLFFFKTPNVRDSMREPDIKDIGINNYSNKRNDDDKINKGNMVKNYITNTVAKDHKHVNLTTNTKSDNNDRSNSSTSSLTVLNSTNKIPSSSSTITFTISNSSVAVASNDINTKNRTTTISTVHSNNTSINQYCPNPPPTLLGFLKVELDPPPSLSDISKQHPEMELGGHYKPANCESKDKVAIIVPFRDREEHLRLFLLNIHPVLKRQMLEYNIYVIEQAGSDPFNRAMLFNVGYLEAMKRFNYTCFIFHDVDLIPENDHNMYDCPLQPRHMSVAIDKMKYQLPYKTLFGGISALRTEHFRKVNGFSNVFWGWGAEDDDFSNRVAFHGLYISRPSPDVARYKMLKHKPQKLNNNRYRMLLKGKQRFNTDGLNSIKYTVDQIVLEKLYTLIRVQLAKRGDG